MVSRPDIAKHVLASNQNVTAKPPNRAPFPLITNAWSMQTMQSVRPKPMNSQFILPDLIPLINKNQKSRPPDPVIIRMPSLQSPKSVGSSSSYKVTSNASFADVVDLCSSEDEGDDQRESVGMLAHSKSLVIPPGISITKVKRVADGVVCQPSASRQERNPTENNNNRSRSLTQLVETTVGGSLPVLKFMGQHPPTMKKEPIRIAAAPSMLIDSSLPIVTPLKLGKLPAEKREQMKQSLLKIQQKEKKSPSSGDIGSPSPSKETQSNSDMVDPLQLSPSLGTTFSPNRDLSRLLRDECKELKHKGLSALLFSNQRQTRRKRVKESAFCSFEEEDYLSDGPSKRTRLDQSPLLRSTRDIRANFDGNDNYSTVIEVDVCGPDNETHESSRASSYGSLTPDGKNSRKRNELINLLKDECKELRRKGLEELSFDADSNQRITRCRTKSLPMLANKR